MKQAPLGTMIPLIVDIGDNPCVVLALKESGKNVRLLGKVVKVYATVIPSCGLGPGLSPKGRGDNQTER